MDYKKLGLRIGLEIHKQIESHKLFCSCPSELVEGEPDLEVKRKLRSVVSETGKKDEVAGFEMSKSKYGVYQFFKNSCCLVELDEEPCHEINKDALRVALTVSKMMNCEFVDELLIMRKQVLDFSNTSSFQRTGLIGFNGYLKTKNGKVKIETVCIEEDAARKVKDAKDYIVYRLDRLGIPLMEIVTAPDMNTPEQAKEVAGQIGMILKSTGRVKNGLGTIRQDVNVSIKGHTRVEIKGVQKLQDIPKLIENEVKRQIKNKNGKSEVRKVNSDLTTSYMRPMPGAARMYVETDVPNVRIKPLLKGLGKVELISDKTKKLEEKGISFELARELVKNGINIEDYNYKDLNFVARVLIEMPKEIEKRFELKSKLKETDFDEVLEKYFGNEISKEAVFEILVEKVKGNKVNYSKYQVVSGDDLEKEIKEIIKKHKDAPINALMGIVMGKYRGKVDGKKVMEILKKNV